MPSVHRRLNDIPFDEATTPLHLDWPYASNVFDVMVHFDLLCAVLLAVRRKLVGYDLQNGPTICYRKEDHLRRCS